MRIDKVVGVVPEDVPVEAMETKIGGKDSSNRGSTSER
jgi:hypothetical protein